MVFEDSDSNPGALLSEVQLLSVGQQAFVEHGVNAPHVYQTHFRDLSLYHFQHIHQLVLVVFLVEVVRQVEKLYLRLVGDFDCLLVFDLAYLALNYFMALFA